MSQAEEYLRGLVRLFQEAFYAETIGRSAEARPFHRDLRLLRLACTWPAGFLRDRGRKLSRGRYREILEEVIAGVQQHGVPPAEMRRRGAYLLQAVQSHWGHHWERYYEESKTLDRALSTELRHLQRLSVAPADPTLDILAEASRLLQTRHGKPSA